MESETRANYTQLSQKSYQFRYNRRLKPQNDRGFNDKETHKTGLKFEIPANISSNIH